MDVFDNVFFSSTNELLKQIRGKYDNKTLKKIKIKKLVILIEYISNYKPKSKILNEKESIIEYLSILNEKDLQVADKSELVILQRKHLDQIINKLNKKGFRFRLAWLLVLIFTTIFDLLIFLLFGFYIPIFSILFIISQVIKDIQAYNQNKLW